MYQQAVHFQQFEEIVEMMKLSYLEAMNPEFSKSSTKFTGSNESVEDFLQKITFFKEKYNITDKKAIEDLGTLLDGEAELWWKNLKRKPKLWTNVTKLMKKVFKQHYKTRDELAIQARSKYFETLLELMEISPIDTPNSIGFSKYRIRFSGEDDRLFIEDFLYNVTVYKYEHNIPDKKAIEDMEILLQGKAAEWWKKLKAKPVTWKKLVSAMRKKFKIHVFSKAASTVYDCCLKYFKKSAPLGPPKYDFY